MAERPATDVPSSPVTLHITDEERRKYGRGHAISRVLDQVRHAYELAEAVAPVGQGAVFTFTFAASEKPK